MYLHEYISAYKAEPNVMKKVIDKICTASICKVRLCYNVKISFVSWGEK